MRCLQTAVEHNFKHEKMKKLLSKAYKLSLAIVGGCCLLYGGIFLIFSLLSGSTKQSNEFIYFAATIAYIFGIFAFCSIHQCKKLKFTIPFAIILPLFIIGSFFGVGFMLEGLGYDLGKGGLIALLALFLSLYIVRRANAWLISKA